MELFARCFSVDDAILPGILNFASRNSSADVTLKLLAQEPNGDVLFSFHDVEAARSSSFRTYVGIYLIEKNRVQLLHEVGKGAVNVVSSSVTSCRTLLGYTICIPTSGKAESSSGCKYELHFVNLVSDKPFERKFSGQSETFLTVQFLPCQRCDSKHQALIFHHKQGIRLYEFTGAHPAAHSGKDVARQHAWYQWDAATSSLYCLQSAARPGRPLAKQNCIRCLQLTDDHKFMEVFEVPINMTLKSRKNTRYDEDYLRSELPDKDINLSVVTLPSGGIAFCWQDLTEAETTSGSDYIEYCVQSPLHSKVINVKVPLHVQLPRCETRRICFLTHKSYVLAYAPGFFLHLIDVCLDSDATHHVIYQSSVSHGAMISGRLSRFYASQADLGFYDASERQAYIVQLTPSYVLDIFSRCYSAYTRLSLLRYLTMYADDGRSITKFLTTVKKDIGSPETISLIMEYIISSGHVSLSRLLSDVTLRDALPYSADNTYGLCRADLQWVHIVKAHSGDRRPAVVQTHITDCPFSDVKERAADAKTNSTTRAWKRAQEEKLCEHWRAFIARSLTCLPPGHRFTVNKLFLDVTERIPNDDSRRRLNGILSNLTQLLSVRLRTDGQIMESEIQNLASTASQEYLNIIQEKLHTLYTTIYAMLPLERTDSSDDSMPADVLRRTLTFKSSPTIVDRVAFQMLERLFYAIVKLGLALPRGFAEVFGQIAYRVLPPRSFVQYLDSGVIVLTDKLSKLFVRGCAPAKCSYEKTYHLQCISRLQQEDAIAASWTVKCAAARKYAAEQAASCYFEAMPADDTSRGSLRTPPKALRRFHSEELEDEHTSTEVQLFTRVLPMRRLMARFSAAGVATIEDEKRFEHAAFYYTRYFAQHGTVPAMESEWLESDAEATALQ